MASSVENRAVSMTFDNSAFEKGVGTTLSTLDKLKNALSFSSSKNGFADITANAGKVDMSALASSVENISGKFSAMGAVAFTVLQDITSRALSAGASVASAFTVTPIATGFSEYELKMGSSQTIMAGTGSSLEEVNAKLNELNTYSDKTIYSFADMTSNIGKFTNAGVNLEDSVSAIQGIANVAALSGANAEEASRAMYNFGQSISGGSVKLMDWKSIELANMATVEFKTELMESAVAAGTLTKGADGLYTTLAGTPVTATKGFNESLNEQWLTADALTTTLGRYSDATTDIGARATAAAQDVKTFTQMVGTMKESVQSGWAASAELIVGDFDEAKALFTGINNTIGGMIGASADARNKMLGEWKALGGRDEVIQGFKNLFEVFTNVAGAISKAFREIFPKKTGQDLYELSVRFREFTEKLKMGEGTLLNIKRVFKGVFAVFSIGIAIVKGIFKVFSTLFGLFGKASGGGILTIFGKVGLALINLQRVLVKEGGIEKAFTSIINMIEKAGGVIASFFGAIFNFFGNLDLSFATNAFESLFSSFKIGNITGVFSGAVKAVTGLKNAIIGFFTGSEKAAGTSPTKTEKSVKKTASMFDMIIPSVKKVIEFFGKATSAFTNFFKAIGSGADQQTFDNILKALKVGLFGGALALLAKFVKDGLKIFHFFDFGQGDLFKSMSGTFDQLTSNLKTMQASVKADIIIKIAVALGVLAASVFALSFIDPVKLGIAMAAIVAGLGALVGVMAIMGKIANDADSAMKLAALGLVIVLISGAVVVLALALKLLDGMNWQETTAGMVGLTGLLLGMTASLGELTKDTNGIVKAAAGLVVVAGALVVLAFALKIMSTMGWEETGVGIATIAAALIVLFATLREMPEGYEMLKMGMGLGVIALSLSLLSTSIWLFDKLDTATFANGLAKIAIVLGVMAQAINLFPKESEILKISFAMGVLAAGMLGMAAAIYMMSKLSVSELAKGVGGIVAAMIALRIATAGEKADIGSGLALTLVAMGIGKLVDAIKQMGKMPLGVMIQGLVAIGLALGALAIGMHLIKPLIPYITAFGFALLMIGGAIGIAAAGIGILLTGLSKLINVMQSGAGKMTETFGAIIEMIPGMVSGLIVGIIDGVLSMRTAIFEGVSKLVLMLLDFLIELMPKLGTVILEFVQVIVKVVREAAPDLIAAGWFIITTWLQGIRDNVGEVVSLVGEIIVNFLRAFTEQVPAMVDALVDLIVEVFRSVARAVGRLAGGLFIDVGIQLLKGLWEGIKSSFKLISDVVWDLIMGVIDWFKSGFGIFSPSRVMLDLGINLIKGLINGIVWMAETLFKWFIALPGLILGFIGDVLSFLWQTGSDLIGGLLSGIGEAAVGLFDWFIGLPGQILGLYADVLSWLWNTGSDIIGGLLEGIGKKSLEIMDWFIGLPGQILGWIGDVVSTLWQKGTDFIGGLFSGIGEKALDVMNWFIGLPGEILGWLGETLTKLRDRGIDLIKGLLNGIREKMVDVTNFFIGLPGKIWDLVSGALGWLKNTGSKIMQGLWDGLMEVWENIKNWVMDKVDWIKEQWDKATSWIPGGGLDTTRLVEDAVAAKNAAEEESKPSTAPIRTNSFQPSGRGESAVSGALTQAYNSIESMNEFTPVITPVLDLSNVERDAGSIAGFFPETGLDAGFIQAANISTETTATPDTQTQSTTPVTTEIRFEQTINSPTALSTNDIYRSTRSQFALAKEELKIA